MFHAAFARVQRARMGQPQGNNSSHGGRVDGSLGINAPVAANFALGAGWGTTASVAVTAGSTDQRGRIVITSAGTGQAQATATVAFTYADGAYAARPFAVVRLVDNTNAVTEAQPMAQAETTTVLSWTHSVLPVATKTYTYEWLIVA